ncbi:MAG TPA: hypothetical protein VEG66_07885 [Thermoplasmata archaeon]|jgi:hypothetical protein|nr:hypothetical protein [Thermoplasmata archaeon]
MAGAAEGPPIIGLPERIDRRMHLGPFPSSRDALKFVSYAATGALLSSITSPWLWLPVVAGGFVVSVWRPDGLALDEQAVRLLAWRARSAGLMGRAMTPRPLVRQGLLQLSSHRFVAVVRTGGTPVAYLPPDELARRFERYRDLLRSTDDSLAFLATTVPIRTQAVLPPTPQGRGRDGRAASGYAQLVSVLCRRRLLRRVYWVIGSPDSSPDAIGRLEGRIATLIEGLGTLGLRPRRLRDRSLAEAARRFGWDLEVCLE